MITERDRPLAREQEEIGRLVAVARRHGETDPYLGKRRWARYTIGMRFEATTDPLEPSAAWPVITHNISGGGVGFWSNCPVSAGAPVFVRDWSDGQAGNWVSACVTHCTVGIQGHLVGVAFEHPAPQEAPCPAGSEAAGTRAARRSTTRRAPARTSLRTKCAYGPAIAGGIAVVTAALVCNYVWPGTLGLWLPVVALVFGLTGLVGWVIAERELHFLQTLRVALRQMAKGEPGASPPAEARSRELAGLRLAFLDLVSAWRKRQDAERLQRQKLEELNQIKSNILSIVSHDLRTPLTSILLYAQMLTEELGDLAREDQERFLGIISDECTRLARLVDDLLEVQRLEAGRVQWDMQPQDLSEAVLGCARLFEAMAQSKSIRFTVDCPASLPPVEADSDKISQALSNLLSNAMKYTPCQGAVHLAVEATGNEIFMRVTDTGPGIPRDKWDQIFDRFSQLSSPDVREIAGVGLGLYIVRQIVERHGGAVWVDSEVGRGSEFCVSLPIKGPTRPPDSPRDVSTSQGRVMVCDADPELASTIARTLRHADYDVRVAHAGCRLLAQLAQGDVEVVVTDVLLPDMNASELLEALANIPRRPFRLVVHSYAGNASELRRRGVDIFLRRPATKEELIQAVQVAMQKRSAAGLTALLLEDGGVDIRRCSSLLSGEGHMPVVVETIEAAAGLTRDYAIDVVMVTKNCLKPDWGDLARFRSTADDNIRVIVLCDGLGKKERRLAEAHRVEAMPYTRGKEEDVVAAITGSAQTLAAGVSP